MSLFEHCWACDYEPLVPEPACEYCGAPVCISDGRPSVYVLAAACGLWKVGISVNVPARLKQLRSEAWRGSRDFQLLVVVPGAGREVERWLHSLLRDVRDPGWARAEGLPSHTEWFWPTPTLRRMVAGLEFVHPGGAVWEDAL